MDIFARMDSAASSFSKTDRLVYNAVNKFPDDFAHSSLAEITSRTNLSQPSLTRFAKKLGFSGFNEFQFQFRQDFQNSGSVRDQSRGAAYGDQLVRTEQFLTDDVIMPIADQIMNASSVYFFGTSLSRIPSEFFDLGLKILGVHPIQALPSDAQINTYGDNDLLICFSAHTGHGCTEFIRKVCEKEQRPHLILVTLNPKHPLRSKFDEVIALPETAHPNIPRLIMNDSFAFFMFIDILMNRIAEILAAERK